MTHVAPWAPMVAAAADGCGSPMTGEPGGDPATAARPHIPVLLAEVVEALQPRDDGVYVDGTFGAGGYSEALLAAARCRVVAIDRDPDAIARGASLCDRFPGRLTLIAGRFGDMAALLAERGVAAVDGVALDLGVSSMQIDQADRGFSFARDGALDMRMDKAGESAADVVNACDEAELARILRDYGEERLARRIARAIVEARHDAPFTGTSQLAEVVRRVVPRSPDGIDPATRTFQALRIHVNDELGELARGLTGAEQVLAPGGQLAVVAFHSLEDRVVKTFVRDRSEGAPRASRHQPETPVATATFRAVTRRAIRPTAAEEAANPRARSARLRVAERTAAPPWGEKTAETPARAGAPPRAGTTRGRGKTGTGKRTTARTKTRGTS